MIARSPAVVAALSASLLGCWGPSTIQEVAPGVAFARFAVADRAEDLLRLRVFWPRDEDGAVLAGPHPAVVLLPGGFVEPARYDWLAIELASREHVVVVAKASANLAIVESDAGAVALQALRGWAEDPEHPLFESIDPAPPQAILGHSLGGATAALLWAPERDDFRALGLLAAFPSAGTPVEDAGDRPSLALTGSEDGLATVDEVEEGQARLPEPSVLAVVQGMNHFDWTDGATAAELARDGRSTRPAEELRADVVAVLDAWLRQSMRGEPGLVEQLALPGVELR